MVAAYFRVIDHNVVRDVPTERDDIFVQIVALIGLGTPTNDKPEAVAALHHCVTS
jgi:hypothetical protein